ncbi:MAG: helix-turn-helix domain-containing protein [Sphingomonas sp.]
MELSDARIVDALSALAQAHRLAAFRLLVEAGASGMAAGEISRRLAVPASSLSFHLAQLERVGLVNVTRRGRSLIYAAQFEAMATLVGYLTDNCCGGDACAVTPRDQSKEKAA